jgi:hypothetical protein
MYAFNDLSGQELHWVKPKWSKLQFELRAGETAVATLTWTGGARALGQWAGGQYQFSRQGWFRRRTFIHTPTGPTDEPVALFTHRGNSGALVFPTGRTFRWQRPTRWTAERVWVVDNAPTALVRCRPARWRSPGVVMIQPAAASLPELPLLLLLGQYLMVQAAQEAAASAAAIVPVIGGT